MRYFCFTISVLSATKLLVSDEDIKETILNLWFALALNVLLTAELYVGN